MKKRTDSSLPEQANFGLDEAWKRTFATLQADSEDELKKVIDECVLGLLRQTIASEYQVYFLVDEHRSISNYHADQFYLQLNREALPGHSNTLLVLHSHGGRIEPAYLISKALKKVTAARFVAAVPRRAKSAATLIALGADEIHMGLISQLGPIDPQIGGIPALAMSNALELIAKMSCQHPAATDLLAKYLTEQIPIRYLGYYQRINESAVQYAERLLEGKSLPGKQPPAGVANHLVNHYRDHGFVIDADEATKVLGEDVIKQDTNEYRAADLILRYLDLVDLFLSIKEKQLSYVGAAGSGCDIHKSPDRRENTGSVSDD